MDIEDLRRYDDRTYVCSTCHKLVEYGGECLCDEMGLEGNKSYIEWELERVWVEEARRFAEKLMEQLKGSG